MDAPKTFLMPISFILCSVENEINPNKPRQEIKIASMEKPVNAFSNLSSDWY